MQREQVCSSRVVCRGGGPFNLQGVDSPAAKRMWSATTTSLDPHNNSLVVPVRSESAAQNQNDAIQDFIKGTIAEKAPVVPISAQLKYNVDAVCEYIVKRIPVPVRDFVSPPQMIVIRSFDVNKPGSEVNELRGGVAGGSILQVLVVIIACWFIY